MSPADPLFAFEQRLAGAWPPDRWQNARIVLAVSGGPDSVALARGMERLAPDTSRGRLFVAHFNHRLRGDDADADERFVGQLAKRLGLDFRLGRAAPGAFDCPADGIEAAARKARYAFLQTTAEAVGARYVVTAHSADDQAETILHHILRGTGLAGLAGIPRARLLSAAITLLRPMLNVNRGEVLAYLDALDQPWRVDRSNESRQFTRARIRHELLPLLARDFNPDVGAALIRLGQLAGDAQSVIEHQAEQFLERALVEAGRQNTGACDDRGDTRSICLRCAVFHGIERHLAREVFTLAWRRQGWSLQDMGFSEWDQLAQLAMEEFGQSPNAQPPDGPRISDGARTADGRRTADGAVREFPGGVRAMRLGDVLTLRKIRP